MASPIFSLLDSGRFSTRTVPCTRPCVCTGNYERTVAQVFRFSHLFTPSAIGFLRRTGAELGACPAGRLFRFISHTISMKGERPTSNLTRASNELFRRSPDERFGSLRELAEYCQQEKQRKTLEGGKVREKDTKACSVARQSKSLRIQKKPQL